MLKCFELLLQDLVGNLLQGELLEQIVLLVLVVQNQVMVVVLVMVIIMIMVVLLDGLGVLLGVFAEEELVVLDLLQLGEIGDLPEDGVLVVGLSLELELLADELVEELVGGEFVGVVVVLHAVKYNISPGPGSLRS